MNFGNVGFHNSLVYFGSSKIVFAEVVITILFSVATWQNKLQLSIFFQV